MLEHEPSERERRHDFLYAIGLTLLVAVACVMAAAVLGLDRISGASVHDKLEYVSIQVANAVTAALVLGAVAALFALPAESAGRARPLLVAALLLGGVIVVLAAFTIVDSITFHVPGPGSSDSFSLALARGASVRDRLASVLPAIAALLVALVAMVGANRLGDFVSGSRGISGDPPDLPEVE